MSKADDLAKAQDPTTPESDLVRLSMSRYLEVRRAVASNLSSPRDALGRLFEDFSLDVVENPASALFNMEDDAPLQWVDAGAQKRVAKDKNTSPIVLRMLAQSDVIMVPIYVAGNPNTPVELLEQWSRSLVWNFQNAVVSNPSTPREVLEFMVENHPGVIAEKAKKRIDSGK